MKRASAFCKFGSLNEHTADDLSSLLSRIALMRALQARPLVVVYFLQSAAVAATYSSSAHSSWQHKPGCGHVVGQVPDNGVMHSIYVESYWILWKLHKSQKLDVQYLIPASRNGA
jgi:hypothetical protein